MPRPKPIRTEAKEVEIHGLADFQRELRKVSETAGQDLRKTHLEAAELVVDKARSKARTVGAQQAAASVSLKAAAEQRYAKIRLGSKKGFELGAEFGSKAYGQFPPWRGNQWTSEGGVGVGYFLHPAIRESGDEMLRVYDRELARLTARAFPH